jgi:hypothetical protein
MIPIIIGYTLVERPDARESLQTMDMGYETEKTNEKYRLKFDAVVKETKLLGHITRVVAADSSAPGKPAFLDTEKHMVDVAGFANPAHAFAAWLIALHGKHISENPRGGCGDLVFFGFNLKPFFRILGPECNVDAKFHTPLGLWHGNDECWDPYEMLVEADYRKEGHPSVIPMHKALKRLGMRLTSDYQAGRNAMADAAMIGEMVYRARIISGDDSVKLAKLLQQHFEVSVEPEALPVTAPAVAATEEKKPKKPKKVKKEKA